MIQLWRWWQKRNNSMQSYCLTVFVKFTVFVFLMFSSCFFLSSWFFFFISYSTQFLLFIFIFFSFSLSFTISCLLVITWFLVSCHNALIEIYSSLTLLIRFIYNLFTFDLCIFNLIVLFLLLLCVLFLSRLFCVFCILALLNFFLYCLKTNKYLIY